jgi:hypothetical protein
MKTFVTIVTVILAIAAVWTYTKFQAVYGDEERTSVVRWEQKNQKESLVYKKIAALKKLAETAELQVNKIENLGLIDTEHLPSVLEYRFSVYSSGATGQRLSEIDAAAEFSIKEILFAQEILKRVDLKKTSYGDFRSYLNDRKSSEQEAAEEAAKASFQQIMAPFKGEQEGIDTLSWGNIPESRKAEYGKLKYN